MTNSKIETRPKTLLFSLTRDDFEWQYFRSGGKGGQNQNKVNSGVRCIHPPSGARGEARDSRDQLTNRRSAFVRCCKSKEFEAWHSREVARRLGKFNSDHEDTERKVEAMMASSNLKVEEYDPNSSA